MTGKALTIPARRGHRGSGVLSELKDMAISYRMKPGEKINEVALATRLGVSRTPVREALTKLAQGGFLVESGRGYMRRPLDIQETLDMYEARAAIERECVRRAIERAQPDGAQELLTYLKHSVSVGRDAPVEELVALDEGFHMRIAQLAGNAEFTRMLGSLNERIRFIRWIDMEKVGRSSTQSEHLRLARAIQARDLAAADKCVEAHISRRREQIVDAIRKGLSRIYLTDES